MEAVEESCPDIGRQLLPKSSLPLPDNDTDDFGRKCSSSATERPSGSVPSSRTQLTCGNSGPQSGPVVGSNCAVTAWTGFIKVDGTTYTWMGAAQVNGFFPPSVTQTSFQYTSERSTFIMNVAGKV